MKNHVNRNHIHINFQRAAKKSSKGQSAKPSKEVIVAVIAALGLLVATLIGNIDKVYELTGRNRKIETKKEAISPQLSSPSENQSNNLKAPTQQFNSSVNTAINQINGPVNIELK